MSSDYYQMHGQSHAPAGRDPRLAAPGYFSLRRLSDFIVMVGIGLAAVIALTTALVGSAHVVATETMSASKNHLWLLTAVFGFFFGLSWRFLFWDLPGMLWHALRYHRRSLQYLFLLGVALILLIMA